MPANGVVLASLLDDLMSYALRSNALKATGLFLAAATLAACQPKPQPTSSVSRAALPTMERIALGAIACWFKSGDPAFKAYRLAPELNSFSGRPRILLVHATARNPAPCSWCRPRATRPSSTPSVPS